MSENRDKIISRRDFLKFGSAFLFSLLTPREIINLEGQSESPEVIKRVKTEAPYYALTIDDGWSPEVLKSMLDLLADKDVRSDFFLVGSAAINCERRMPGLLRRLAEGGHRIVYHTMYHNEKSQSMSVFELNKDFMQWKKTLRFIIGDDLFDTAFSGCARAVGGYFYRDFLLFCTDNKLIPCGWSVTPTPESFDKGYRIKKGDIVLYHVRGTDLGYLRWLLNLPIDLGATDILSLISKAKQFPEKERKVVGG